MVSNRIKRLRRMATPPWRSAPSETQEPYCPDKPGRLPEFGREQSPERPPVTDKTAASAKAIATYREDVAAKASKVATCPPDMCLVEPEERLRQLANEFGARAALSEFFQVTIPETIAEPQAQRIVRHFVEEPLHLPWHLTPWWKPKCSSLATSTLPGAPIDFLEPEELDVETEDSAVAFLFLQDFGSQAVPPHLQSKYERYFQSLDSPQWAAFVPSVFSLPLLHGVIRPGDLWNWGALLAEEINESLTMLETMEELPEAVSAEVEDFFADSSLEHPGEIVTEDIMRRIWARRIAVSIWSDANGHWPWSLRDLGTELRNVLLGWNPQEYSELDTASKLYLTDTHQNGQGIFFRERENGTRDFSTGYVWAANPLFEWLVGSQEVLPHSQTSAGGDASVGLMAITRWVYDRAYLHDEGTPEGDDHHTYPGFVTLPQLIAGNYGGCHYTAMMYNAPWDESPLRGLTRPDMGSLLQLGREPY